MNTNQAFEILKSAGGIQAARILIGDAKKLSKIRVLWMAHQLRRRVPVSKINHEKWFYGLKFYTNRHTLDPRPDTETLVTAVLSEHKNNDQQLNIMDLGTGTGCLVAAIVKNLQNVHGIGIDKSCGAVRVARKNIRDLGLSDSVRIYRNSFDSKLPYGQFDIIVSNPPYIAHDDDRVNRGAMFDPQMALFAKNNGLAAYESIAKNACDWIKPGGKIYLEIGIDMGGAVREIFANNGWEFVKSYDDLSGIERVLEFTTAF
ncbi:peptide chain release factor N(5)-glutamine methyltransferase [Lachnospiraceae bacterium OttesenSCG-928-E19]|nr:peptide chain release factor N(5)-glutamine methyltransferase [Lachnospiraceae bacterium OttesenSCG-928-E19]